MNFCQRIIHIYRISVISSYLLVTCNNFFLLKFIQKLFDSCSYLMQIYNVTLHVSFDTTLSSWDVVIDSYEKLVNLILTNFVTKNGILGNAHVVQTLEQCLKTLRYVYYFITLLLLLLLKYLKPIGIYTGRDYISDFRFNFLVSTNGIRQGVTQIVCYIIVFEVLITINLCILFPAIYRGLE